MRQNRGYFPKEQLSGVRVQYPEKHRSLPKAGTKSWKVWSAPSRIIHRSSIGCHDKLNIGILVMLILFNYFLALNSTSDCSAPAYHYTLVCMDWGLFYLSLTACTFLDSSLPNSEPWSLSSWFGMPILLNSYSIKTLAIFGALWSLMGYASVNLVKWSITTSMNSHSLCELRCLPVMSIAIPFQGSPNKMSRGVPLKYSA